ncbi:MAG: hypothetical protein IPO60_01740 [Flavobacteriales bacterium]|nr:hypothetical protein [Flavobacteriales bacterium]MBK9597062.1 hypothetical protein [Flavobacteriales bacterium]
MLRPILTSILALSLFSAIGQQVLFSEDFEGAQPAFTLNTTDMASTAGGDNSWLVNSSYAGGDGTLVCFGFPFSFNIPLTAAQPAGISNANGSYMHITSAAAVSSGITNCNFAAADGLCTDAANHFTRMSSDVSTVGASEVNLTFWWLCAGGPNSYGEVYYSTDAGMNWTMVSTPVAAYRNQSAWIQQTLTMPAFAGQATLRFGFRFVNAEATAASDPAFGIDDVVITSSSDENAIAAGTLAFSSYCAGSAVTVPYTASGAWNAGNVFTAELSDINGSFSSAVDIGSVASTTSGSIAGTIPPGTATGTGYQVRVTGSDPSGIADTSATVITITDAPNAGTDTHASYCETDDPQVLINLLPGASACGQWTGPTGSVISGILDPATAVSGPYTYTTNCPGNCPQDAAVITVGIVPAADAGENANLTVCSDGPAFFLLDSLGGTPNSGGAWSGGLVGGMYDPAVHAPGCYTYTVTGVSPCANAMATVCVAEETCTGINEMNGGLVGLRWSGQQGGIQRIDLGANRIDAVDLLDASGRRLRAATIVEGQTLSINMAGMASGIYVVRIHSADRVGVLRLVNGK